MRVAVRAATSDDADAIATAHVRAWQVAHRGLVPDAFLDDPAMARHRHGAWRRQLASTSPRPGRVPFEQVLAGTVAGRLVGFGHLGFDHLGGELVDGGAGDARGELYGFGVHPDAWGSGVADVMMRGCLDELRRRVDVAVLWVLADHPRARRCSERSGWAVDRGPDGTPVTGECAGPATAGIPALPRTLPEVRSTVDLATTR